MTDNLFYFLLALLLISCQEDQEHKQESIEQVIPEQGKKPGIGVLYLKENTFEVWRKNELENFQPSLEIIKEGFASLPLGRYKLVEKNQVWFLSPIEKVYPFDSLKEIALDQVFGKASSLSKKTERKLSDIVEQIWVLPCHPKKNSLASGSFAADPQQVAQFVYLEECWHQLNSKQYSLNR